MVTVKGFPQFPFALFLLCFALLPDFFLLFFRQPRGRGRACVLPDAEPGQLVSLLL